MTNTVELHPDLLDEVMTLRKKLHSEPELSGQEFLTTKLIREKLMEYNIKVIDTPLEVGVLAEIGNSSQGPIIALRADIDALPIHEKTNLAYQSKNKGVAHSCGHDFHTASLLGAAIYLKQHEDDLNGRVRLIFQSAEEINQGAKEMIHIGALNDISYILGFHNKPDLPIGTIGIKSGPLMAAVDQFKVNIRGVGSHAAAPHNGNDPIVTACQIVTSIQSIISRHISPLNPSILSVTHIEGGNTWNVIPDDVLLEGTIRTFNEKDRMKIKQLFENTVLHYTESFNQTHEIIWIESPPVVYNDSYLTDVIASNTKKFANVIVPEVTLGGEDFANYQQKIPGCFVFIGTNTPYEWHNPSFLVDDNAMPFAIKYYVENTIDLLNSLYKNQINQ